MRIRRRTVYRRWAHEGEQGLISIHELPYSGYTPLVSNSIFITNKSILATVYLGYGSDHEGDAAQVAKVRYESAGEWCQSTMFVDLRLSLFIAPIARSLTLYKCSQKSVQRESVGSESTFFFEIQLTCTHRSWACRRTFRGRDCSRNPGISSDLIEDFWHGEYAHYNQYNKNISLHCIALRLCIIHVILWIMHRPNVYFSEKVDLDVEVALDREGHTVERWLLLQFQSFNLPRTFVTRV